MAIVGVVKPDFYPPPYVEPYRYFKKSYWRPKGQKWSYWRPDKGCWASDRMDWKEWGEKYAGEYRSWPKGWQFADKECG